MLEIAGLAQWTVSSMLPSIVLDTHVSVSEPVIDVASWAVTICISIVDKQPTATLNAVPNQVPSAEYERK
jgi:hypothetical protein